MYPNKRPYEINLELDESNINLELREINSY